MHLSPASTLGGRGNAKTCSRAGVTGSAKQGMEKPVCAPHPFHVQGGHGNDKHTVRLIPVHCHHQRVQELRCGLFHSAAVSDVRQNALK